VPAKIVADPLNRKRSSIDRTRPLTRNRSAPCLVVILTTPRISTECDHVMRDLTDPATVPVARPEWWNVVEPVVLTSVSTTCSRTDIERSLRSSEPAAPDVQHKALAAADANTAARYPPQASIRAERNTASDALPHPKQSDIERKQS
jgi:hypothetical protein